MKKRTLLILFISLIMANFIFADEPQAITTFESIGIYWTPPGGANDKDVFVRYRVKDNSTWLKALPMKYRPIVDYDDDSNPDEKGEYRGSIVNLTPNTEYEVELSLGNEDGPYTRITENPTTWKEVENLTIASTNTVGDGSSTYTISSSGTETGYILYDGTNSVIDVDSNRNYCIKIEKGVHHVIIRGFKLEGAIKHGIYIKDSCENIIIENCDISNWGYKSDGFAHEHDGGVRSDGSDVKRIVIQRCRIHHPRNGANSWAVFNAGNGDPEDEDGAFHPRGAQAVVLMNSGGNHVIRYNEFYSDGNRMFNDIIGSGGNASFSGFPTADTDIYGNYLSHCWDDAIEVEGADRNVRVWGNFFENFFVGIANAPVSTGPLYVWGNTSGRSFSPEDSREGIYGQFMKMGTTSGKDNMMQGYTYIFNNTILQPNGEGAGGIGTKEDHDRKIHYCIAKNNILHVRNNNTQTPPTVCERSLSNRSGNTNFTYSHNLWSAGHPAGENKTPTYINDASVNVTHSGSTPITVNYFLKSSSDGYNDGTPIPNFTTGSSPDMGAFEHGNSPREYGVNAYLGGSPSQYTLATNVSGSGSISLSPSGGVYNSGTEVTLTATPNSGWKFDGWSGDLSGSNSPTTITITSNKSVTANFSEISGETLTYDAFYATINTGTTSTTNVGYNGDGYANVDNEEGTYVEWSNVNVNTAGSYNCTIRYASNSNRPGNVEVNGSVVTTLQGTSTGNFQTWGTETVTFDLNAGNNTIKLIGTTSSSLGNIDQIVLEYVGGVSEEIEVSVSDDDDDAEENTANGKVDTGSSDLEMAEDGSKTQIIGIRFSGVNIPKGAAITNAYIEFEAKNTESVSTSLTIKGEDIDDSPAFVDDSYYTISNRNTTTESENWNSIQTWNDGSTYQTPNIGDIVEEIVGRSGWNSGNALSLIISGSGVRRAYSHNKANHIPPKLHVEYTTQSVVENDIVVSIASIYDDAEEKGGPVYPTSSGLEMAVNGSTAQTIGLRFTGIEIPQGATITNAYVQFTAYGTSSVATSLTIRGENTDDAETFTDTPNSISARPTTSESVSWDNIVAWNTAGESGAAQQTPPVNEIIEDIVGRAGWNSGNSLVLIITGSGTRKAYAYSDSHVDEVAELHITYQTLAKEQSGNIEEEVIPTSYTFSNYPNPFNPSTNIAFTLPKSGQVKIVIYDMLGREVSKVVDNFYESGNYNYSWMAKDKNGSPLASGIYIARIQVDNFVKSIKMMLLR